jgi:hypothetical protein
MDRVGWDWILNGLDGTLRFCRDLGLVRHVEGSRFEKHRAWVAELIAELKTGGQEAARAAFHRDPVRSFTALTEGSELAGILPFLLSVSPEMIKRKLRDVLKGPPLATAETANTNQARNVLFELNVASKLWRGGFAPELGEQPDVGCWVDGRAVYVECKRPFSENGARQAYTDALAQIDIGLKSAPAGARGVVALSVTRLLNTGEQIFVHGANADLEDRLGELLEQTVDRMGPWPTPGPATIGVLWHLSTPAFDMRQALFGVAEQLNVACPPGSTDSPLFRKLVGKIQAIGTD